LSALPKLPALPNKVKSRPRLLAWRESAAPLAQLLARWKVDQFISNLSGVPQVWIMPAEGGFPRMITNGDDPVTGAEWSPASDWLAVTIAPGGGLNTQSMWLERMARNSDG